MVRVIIVLCVASQLSNLWRNDSRSTDKQKTFEQDFLAILYSPYAGYANNAIWRLTLDHVNWGTGIGFFLCENIAIVLNNKHK